ncbi:MAG: transcriptional regulator [Acidimicrobiia bacterium]|nr:transcriptional regulator [Acidimicrobiia bacterium]
MPDYGRFCPVALGSEVFADRWTPLIVRELILGNTRFNDLARGLPGISRSLLVQRLRHLERMGVVELWPSPTGRGHEYHLTAAGKDLEAVVLALGRWAVEWLFDDLQPHDVDPVTLTWWMHRRVDESRLPPQRVVIEFQHTGPTRQAIWMVLDRGEASVCVQHPGFDPDVLVTTTTPALAEVFQGYDSWARAVATGAIRVDGPPRLVRSLPRWFLWSPFADRTSARVARSPRGQGLLDDRSAVPAS